jgi:hypothetical protein
MANEIVKLGTAHVALVVDASPSMEPARSAAVRGVNGQVEALRASSSVETRVSVLVFDGRVVERAVDDADLGKVPRFTEERYNPARGNGTNLYDAAHEAIDALDPRVEKDQTALVVLVTDGEENCSRRGSVSDLAARIHKRFLTGRWTFALLGPRASAERAAAALGIPAGNVSDFETSRAGDAFARNSRALGAYFDARGRGQAQSEVFYLGADEPKRR